FTGVGNGDTLLDPGESITFCETVHLISCVNSSSEYLYSWGCGKAACKTKSISANVVFPSEVPNVKITRKTSYSLGTLGMGGSCYGNTTTGGFDAWVIITNNGTGTAYNGSFAIG